MRDQYALGKVCLSVRCLLGLGSRGKIAGLCSSSTYWVGAGYRGRLHVWGRRGWVT